MDEKSIPSSGSGSDHDILVRICTELDEIKRAFRSLRKRTQMHENYLTAFKGTIDVQTATIKQSQETLNELQGAVIGGFDSGAQGLRARLALLEQRITAREARDPAIDDAIGRLTMLEHREMERQKREDRLQENLWRLWVSWGASVIGLAGVIVKMIADVILHRGL